MKIQGVGVDFSAILRFVTICHNFFPVWHIFLLRIWEACQACAEDSHNNCHNNPIDFWQMRIFMINFNLPIKSYVSCPKGRTDRQVMRILQCAANLSWNRLSNVARQRTNLCQKTPQIAEATPTKNVMSSSNHNSPARQPPHGGGGGGGVAASQAPHPQSCSLAPPPLSCTNNAPAGDPMECSIYQNYSASEVFVQGLAGVVNQQDVESMIRAQKKM